jgi:hypothetical protein
LLSAEPLSATNQLLSTFSGAANPTEVSETSEFTQFISTFRCLNYFESVRGQKVLTI